MSKESTVNPVTGEIELPDGYEEMEIPSRRHEVLGVIAVLVALAALLAFVSYDGLDPEGAPIPDGNLIGRRGPGSRTSPSPPWAPRSSCWTWPSGCTRRCCF